jgi:hypothetical protein
MSFAPYTPTTPNSTDTFPGTQQIIENNFTSLNQQISVNHVALNAASNNGQHTFVSFVPQATDPASAVTTSILYTKTSADTTVSEPYFGTGLSPNNNIYKVPLTLELLNIATISGSAVIAIFTGVPTMHGTLFAYSYPMSSSKRTLFSPFVWDGTNVYVPNTPVSPDYLAPGQLSSSSTGALAFFTATGPNLSITNLGSSHPNINLLITGVIM